MDDELLHLSVSRERNRYFTSARWSGPFGVVAGVGFYGVIISNTASSPGALRWWVIAMLGLAVLQIGAFAGPSRVRRLDSRGVPLLSSVAHGLIGAGWGSLLWLDLDVTRVAEFRWVTIAMLFCVSAAVVGGIPGLKVLGMALFVPMWVGSATALVAAGSLAAAAGCAVFAALCLRDINSHGRLWTELIVLRVQSQEIAGAHEWAANHDSLTSLANRSHFVHMVEERARLGDGPISVMFLDLDRFKEVNDRLGHAAGDHVLVETANRIRALLRAVDLVGRFGGDEFCVLLGQAHDERSAEHLAHRLIDAIEQPFDGPWGAERVYISASIGIASLASLDASPERLLLDADFAMYEAKRRGRRRVVHFNSDLQADLSERLGLESDFRRLLRDSALGADGQPIFDLQTGSIRCVELLARWRLPGGGNVPPSVFIPLAVELGLIGEVTNLMLRMAATQLRSWADHPELGVARVSVNVSATELQQGDVASAVADVVTEFGIERGRLVLELTDSSKFDGSNKVLAQFEALRELGVELALDDFGTGTSSLDSLMSLPVSSMKIDASFVAKLGADRRHRAVLRHMHDLASVIGHNVVVKGVETAEQLEELEQIGAVLAQGFHLCRPVPIDSLGEHVRALSTSI